MGPTCLGNISKDWSVDNAKRTGYVYEFSVDYEAIAVGDIKNISIWWRKWYSVNVSSVIKKIFIVQKINHTCIKYTSCFATYKMGKIRQINIKNWTYYFAMTLLISKILMQGC